MYEELLESSEFYQKRYHNFSSLLIFPVLLLFLGLALFLSLCKKEISLKSLATVEPVEVLAQIRSTSSNKIVSSSLKENKIVAVGDVLLEYEAVSEALQERTSQTQLDTLEKQKKQLEFLKLSFESGSSQFPAEDDFGYFRKFEDYLYQRQTLSSTIEQQNGTIAAQNAASSNSQAAVSGVVNQLANKVSDYNKLREAISSGASVGSQNQGYSFYSAYVGQIAHVTGEAEKEVLKNQTLAQLDTQIKQYQSELGNYQVQYAGSGVQQAYNSSLDSQLSALKAQKLTEVSQELNATNQKITELKQGLELANESLSKTKITSEVSGIVHLNESVIKNDFVQVGTLMAQIFPLISAVKAVKVETYFPAKDVTSLAVGDKVLFKTQNASNKEMTLTSKISSIDNSATKTEKGSFFKVEAIVSLSDKELDLLRYGSSGEFVVITGEKTYLDYYLDQFLN